ncbi:hypothetical protein cyc_05595 [Cyclospora cayetanensis]|uniref:Uncharacterized protein n=1 Tax=Cyclospora cayetanensis TaxID=88456 RepID=A0A1D3CR63_9EIME|nr:hypothetical protein cyc_05595 [Cyclospora cayetanensis]
MRLSMARANVNTLLEADARREREHELLKNRVSVLEDEIHSHVSRATEAEARAADFRTRLVRANASKDRLAAELVQAKKQLDIESTRRQYLSEATLMSETQALEFLQGERGEGIDGALRLQHSAICELQSENARLRSEKMEQRRQLKAEIQRKDVVIQRLKSTEIVRDLIACVVTP